MLGHLMHDFPPTFTEGSPKTRVRPNPPRPEPQARRMPPAPAPEPVGADELFSGPARRVAPPAPSPAPRMPAPALSSSAGTIGGATAAAVPEVGRNDPCPCGSGRKYKKCHGAGR